MKNKTQNRQTLTGKLSLCLHSSSVLCNVIYNIANIILLKSFFFPLLAPDLFFPFVPPRLPVGPLGVNHVSIHRGAMEKELQPSQEPNPKHTALQLSPQSPASPFLLLRSQIPLPLPLLCNQSQVILFISPPHSRVILLHYCNSLSQSQVYLQL